VEASKNKSEEKPGPNDVEVIVQRHDVRDLGLVLQVGDHHGPVLDGRASALNQAQVKEFDDVDRA